MKAILTILLIASGICSHAQEIDQAIQKRIDASVQVAVQAALQKLTALDTADAILPLEITRQSLTQYKLSIRPATSTSAGSYTPAHMSATEQQINTIKQEAIADKARIALLEAKVVELSSKLAGLKATTTIIQ